METKIENSLNRALLHDGSMEYALYKFELEEHTSYWKKGLIADKEDFVFIVTINKGDVAMLLISAADEIFINEKARERLKFLWKNQYKTNIETLLPSMVSSLSNDVFFVTGVKFVDSEE